MKVLACAVGFGLGPAGKLCSIVNYNQKYEWYACGDELDLSIYRQKPFIDTCWSKNESVISEFVKKYDIKYAVDVLDPDLAILLKKIGVKVVYVDSIPFIWTDADFIPYNVDCYCAQKYPNYSKSQALNKIENFFWVNPIIPEIVSTKRDVDVVINFGGLHSPFGEGKEYYELVMKVLLPALHNRNIRITGGQNVIKLTKELFPDLSCDTYTHEDFLELVSSSSLFITSPGLTTIYETCEMDIKTVIMPPQNLSQFYNSSIAEKICKNVKIIKWNHDKLSTEYLKCFNNKPEEETVKYIYEQISILSKDEKYISKFKQYILNILNDNFIVNEPEDFEYNGVINISEILSKIMEEI